MTAQDKHPDTHHRRPWRDNIESVTMAITAAVMLKYFIVEAYKIPTGSMQPTLMGNEDTGVFDRIIVDKLSYHFRDPERFEVVVFKYPLDRSKNFIKRVCGMPGEDLKIDAGDLWTRRDKNDDWKIVRRSEPVQKEVWKRIDPADPRYQSWKPEGGARTWTIDGRDTITARGEGSVRLPNDGGSVMDNYRDGYPGTMANFLSRARGFSGSHPVGDIRVTGDVEALPGCKAVIVELREGARVYRFTLPGPAATGELEPWNVQISDADKPYPEQPNARVVTAFGHPNPGRSSDGDVAHAWRLPAGKRVAFAAQNMDDMLTLEIDGQIQWEIEIPAARDQRSSFTLRVDGEGADFTNLQVYRDIYYTNDTSRQTEFTIPLEHYVMLGDNTQDSSDSREWVLAKYRLDGEEVRGNSRMNNENPTTVLGGPEGSRLFFRDEWGDLHTFLAHSGEVLQPDQAPFVPRNLITGRAVIVFWPLTGLWPGNWVDKSTPIVWRLKWIH